MTIRNREFKILNLSLCLNFDPASSFAAGSGCSLVAKVEVEKRYQGECQVADVKCDNKEQQWLVLWSLKSSAFLAGSENAGHECCVQWGWCLSNTDPSISFRCAAEPQNVMQKLEVLFSKRLNEKLTLF